MHPWACANISRMYAIGDGVEKNPQEAEKYKRLAKKYSGQEIKIWKIELKYSLLYAYFSIYVSILYLV